MPAIVEIATTLAIAVPYTGAGETPWGFRRPARNVR